MWSLFLLGFVAAGVFLYIPGVAFFRGLGFSVASSVCLSPAVSLLVYCLLGVLYERFGLFSCWHSMLPAALLLCATLGVMFALVRRRLSGTHVPAGGEADAGADIRLCDGLPHLDLKNLALFIAMALIVGAYVFVLPLDGPDSFAQNWDNAFHFNATAQFLRTGNYSMLSMGAWGPGEIAPVVEAIGYYPASWSIVVALVASLTGSTIPCAMNAANLAFMSLVFPSSMCFLIYVLFGGNRLVCRAAAVVSPLFVAFPWVLVEFGSLNPNLAGLSLSPLIVGSFVLLGYQLIEGRAWRATALAFATVLISSALAHPNAVFSAAVMLAPFCVWALVRFVRERWSGSGKLDLRLGLVALVTSCVLVALWVLLAFLPPLKNVVTNSWNYGIMPLQAVIDLITLSFVRDYGQPLLGLLVLVGFVSLFREGQATWITISCVLASFIFLVSAVLCSDFGEYSFKAIVSGFWYQDPYRTAATVVLTAIPLASAGLARVMVRLERHVNAMQDDWRGSRCVLFLARDLFPYFAVGIIALAILWPSFRVPGVMDVITGFGGFRGDMASSFDTSDNVLDIEERRFLERVSRVIPDGALVVNMPDDGSVFASGLYGLNTYYRVFGVQWKTDETDQSKVLREHADEVAYDPEVRDAFSTINAKYLLVLDDSDEENGTRRFLVSFHPECWGGIEGIHDGTPGLRVVLSEGDMRLYRVIGS